MPKENTHLYFATRLLEKAGNEECMAHMIPFKSEFFLGSVFPDSFYYHPQKELEKISDRLHGRGADAGQMIIDLMAAAKQENRHPDFAFAMGYIAHWSLDKLFHPVIEQLCGDYHDPDAKKRLSAVYHHRLLETELDRRVNHGCYVHEMIQPEAVSDRLSGRILAECIRTAETEILRAFQRQKRLNRMMTTNWAYQWARLLKWMGKKGMNEILPLFYSHLNHHREPFPDAVYDDSNQEAGDRYISIEDLFQAAESFACAVFGPAHDFLVGPENEERTHIEEIRHLLTGSV